ncbi:alkylated DNA repair protein alkB homolog 8-like [Nilaparvata lugens]|uniref:alkylated DNA repair protein alkB homolog 8-like n=1 Tax=Nilaparvata lugens TaxID=108931 RepID=UPI00193D59B7|nr:alkylated DNA repair protein alkB homolog 8-like [Nilaparvata lugens]
MMEDRKKKIIKEEKKLNKSEEIVGEVKEERKKENVSVDGGSSKHCHTVQNKCAEENLKKANSKSCENDKVSEFSLPVHNNRTQFKHDDILVPWTNKKETFFRYYHVFKEGELEELCSFVPEIKVEKVYYDQGNWCVVFVKC